MRNVLVQQLFSNNGTMQDWIQLFRPKHYVKNGFVLLPLFFAGAVTHPSQLFSTAIAFICFSLVASAVYILNDARDVEADRLHPEKKHRPLAAKRISLRTASITLVLLLITATLLAYLLLPISAVQLLTAYFALNVAYSYGLKAVAILDIVIVAIGFVLRLLVGAAAANIELSHWIITMTFLLALFLALAKRRDDVQLFLESGDRTRKAVDGYSLDVVNHGMSILSAVMIVAYLMYCTDPSVQAHWQAPWLYTTTVWVLLGVLRYLQITFIDEKSGNPTKIFLKDRFIQTVVIGWLATFTAIIYV